MNIQPLNDNVFIKPIVEELTNGLIILKPTSHLSHREPFKAKVVAFGPGKYNKKGVRKPLGLSVGDTIIYTNHDIYNKVKIEDEEITIINSQHIIAVVE